MASPSNNRNRNARPTGGRGGGRAGTPNKPIAGTKDRTVRVPTSWNAQVVDPTNNRGAGQRPTGGQAGGRAGMPGGSIARPPAKPPTKPPTTTVKPSGNFTAPSIPKPAKPTVKPRGIRGLNGSQKLGLEVLGIPTGVTSAATRLALSDFGSSGENPDVQARRMGFKDAADRARRVKAQEAKEGGGSKPKKLSRPASDYEKLFNPGGSRANYGLKDKAPEAPTLAAAVTRTSSSGRSSSSSRGSSTQRSGSSSSPSAASSTSSTSGTPAKPGQKFADFNPGRGTSKTNNPLMKDMVGRMKDREDKAQASSASKLTSKFNTNANFSGEKVDGSGVDTRKKMTSTINEYNSKKRRNYG